MHRDSEKLMENLKVYLESGNQVEPTRNLQRTWGTKETKRTQRSLGELQEYSQNLESLRNLKETWSIRKIYKKLEEPRKYKICTGVPWSSRNMKNLRKIRKIFELGFQMNSLTTWGIKETRGTRKTHKKSQKIFAEPKLIQLRRLLGMQRERKVMLPAPDLV